MIPYEQQPLTQPSLHKDTASEAAKNSFKVEYQKKSRDNARTPMQWDDSPNAGFTTGNTPWMRVHDNYKEVNAASQVNDPTSIYHTYRQVLENRKKYKDIFVYGDFGLVDEPNDKIFAYERVAPNGDKALVVSNFSADTVSWSWDGKAKEVLVSPAGKKVDDVNGGAIQLGAYEGLTLLL